MKNNSKKFIKVSALVISFIPILAFGAGLASDCDGSPTNPCDFNALMATFKHILNFVLIDLASIIFIVGILRAGWIYLNSGGDPSAHKKASGIFFHMVIGYILVLASWLIIKTFIILFTGETPSFSTFFYDK